MFRMSAFMYLLFACCRTLNWYGNRTSETETSTHFDLQMKQIREMLKCRSAEVAIQSETIKNLHTQINNCETSAACALQCLSLLGKVVFGDCKANPLSSAKMIDDSMIEKFQTTLDIEKLDLGDLTDTQDIKAHGLWTAIQNAHEKAREIETQRAERERVRESEMQDLQAALDAVMAQLQHVQTATQERLGEKNVCIMHAWDILCNLHSVVYMRPKSILVGSTNLQIPSFCPCTQLLFNSTWTP